MKKLIILFTTLIFTFFGLNSASAELQSYTKINTVTNEFYYSSYYNSIYLSGTNNYRNSNTNQGIIYYYYVKGSNPGPLILYHFGSTYFQTDLNRPRANGSTFPNTTTNPFSTSSSTNLCFAGYIETITSDNIKHRYCSNPATNLTSSIYIPISPDTYKSNFYCTGSGEILTNSGNVISCYTPPPTTPTTPPTTPTTPTPTPTTNTNNTTATFTPISNDTSIKNNINGLTIINSAYPSGMSWVIYNQILYNNVSIYSTPHYSLGGGSANCNADNSPPYYSTYINSRITQISFKRCYVNDKITLYFDTQTKKIITPTTFFNPDNNKFYGITNIATVYNIGTDGTLTAEPNGLTLPSNFVLPKVNQSIYKKNLNGWIYQGTDNNLYFLSTDFTKYKTLATGLNGLVAGYGDFIFYSSHTTNNIYSLDHCNSTTCGTATSGVLVQEQYKLKDNLTLIDFIGYIKETNNYIFLDNQNILYSSSPISNKNSCSNSSEYTYTLKNDYTIYGKNQSDYTINTNINYFRFKNNSNNINLEYIIDDFPTIEYYTSTGSQITNSGSYKDSFFNGSLLINNGVFSSFRDINIYTNGLINYIKVNSDNSDNILDYFNFKLYGIDLNTGEKLLLGNFKSNEDIYLDNNYSYLSIELGRYLYSGFKFKSIDLKNYDKTFKQLCYNSTTNTYTLDGNIVIVDENGNIENNNNDSFLDKILDKLDPSIDFKKTVSDYLVVFEDLFRFLTITAPTTPDTTITIPFIKMNNGKVDINNVDSSFQITAQKYTITNTQKNNFGASFLSFLSGIFYIVLKILLFYSVFLFIILYHNLLDNIAFSIFHLPKEMNNGNFISGAVFLLYHALKWFFFVKFFGFQMQFFTILQTVDHNIFGFLSFFNFQFLSYTTFANTINFFFLGFVGILTLFLVYKFTVKFGRVN